MRYPVLSLFLPLFFPALLHGQEPSRFKTVERYIATFDPPVYASPDSAPCVGLLMCEERVVMSRECLAAARQAMLSGSVAINNIDGERIGVFPDTSSSGGRFSPMVMVLVSDPQVLAGEEEYP